MRHTISSAKLPILEKLFPESQPSNNLIRICLSFELFYAAFDTIHSPAPFCEKLSIRTFNRLYYIPHLKFEFSIFYMTELNVKLLPLPKET